MTAQLKLPVNAEAIPEQLRQRDRWVLWRYELVPGQPKPTKVPYRAGSSAGDLRKASVTNPRTLSPFDVALAALQDPANVGKYSGLGFVVTDGDGIVGIDLDDVRDPVSGELAPEAAEIVASFASYAEVSPSGEGVRAFVLGTLEGLKGRSRKYDTWKAEAYSSGRYLTVTGDQLPGTPATIEERQTQLERVHAKYIAQSERDSISTSSDWTTVTMGSSPTVVELSDVQVLGAAWASKNGKPIRALYAGDTSAHDDDDSAADLALCGHLAFFADYRPAQVDRLFRASGLMRAKWDENRGANTYGERTIATAIEGKVPGDGYRPSAGPPAAPTSTKASPTWSPAVTCMADVEREEVSWLWHPYVPIGNLTLVEGDPGLGKTWLLLAVAAALTTGRPLPGEDRTNAREPRNVIYMSAEDGLGDTLRPRLESAGADLRRVFAITGKQSVGDDGEAVEAAISLADVPQLAAAMEAYRPAMLVIDPLQAYLGAGVDMHRANETRPVLAALRELAQTHSCAAVIIRHLRKSSADRAIYRGVGTIDFAAAARSILLVDADPDDSFRRVLAHSKSSLAHPGSSFGFEIVNGALEWLGPSLLTADELLAPRKSSAGSTAKAEAADWLIEVLEDGQRPVSELEDMAKAAGHSWGTVKRAKSELGVVARRSSNGNQGGGAWQWELQVPPSGPVKLTETLAPLASNTDPDANPARDSTKSVNSLRELRPGRENPQVRKEINPFVPPGKGKSERENLYPFTGNW